MAKPPGTSTSRPVSSHEDSNNPRLTLFYLSRGPSFLSYMSMMPLSSLQTQQQSTVKSHPSSNHSSSPMKVNSKITWGLKYPDGWIELQQKKMIDNCLDMLGMEPSSKTLKTHDTPAESSKILHADEDGANQKHAWNYQAVVGCLNYLQAITQPDLAYSIHQCVCFGNNPKLLHEQGLK